MPVRHEERKGSGSHALAGYEHQIDVSSWLALDLVLVSKRTSDLTLEPLSALAKDLPATLRKALPSGQRAA
jgi:hypothetical protein